MSLENKVKATGELEVLLYGADGKIKERRVVKNLVVDAGEVIIAQAMANESPTLPSHMAIGTSNTAVDGTQTALQGTELDRNALTSTTRSTSSVTYQASWAAGDGTGTIEEAGLFDAASAGNMFARALTGTIVKGASDALTINWTVTFSGV
jgi:hypothetical protein